VSKKYFKANLKEEGKKISIKRIKKIALRRKQIYSR